MPPKASSKLNPLESKLNKIGLGAVGGKITQDELFRQAGITATPTTQDAINALSRKNLIKIMMNGNGDVSYQFVGKDEAKSMGTMDSDERLVLDQIKDSGDQGLWTKTLGSRTGLPRNNMMKALKSLEGKKLIKTVKSVKTPTRKIYMLVGINPCVEMTGGPWFTDNELDVDFVTTLKKCAMKYLRDHSAPPIVRGHRKLFPLAAKPLLPTVSDIQAYISSLKVSAIELLDEHVASLLDDMIADGLIEKIFLHNVAANGHANASSARKRPFEDSDTGSEDEDEAKAKKDEQAKARAKAKAKKAASSLKPKKKKKKGNAMLSDASSGDDVAMADFNSDDDDDKPAVQEGGGGGGGGSRRKKNRNKRALDSDEEDAPTSDSSGEEDTAQTAASRKKMLKANHEAMVSGAYHSDYVYRIVPSFEPRTGWIDMPCGECPSQAFCAELPRSPAAHHHRSAPYGRGAPRVGIEIGGMQGVGMMGGAGAAIGASNNKWGDARGVDVGAAPVNPKDCEYFTEWLKF